MHHTLNGSSSPCQRRHLIGMRELCDFLTFSDSALAARPPTDLRAKRAKFCH